MKKVALLLAVAFALGMLLTACHPTQSCPAYGDYNQYQRESAY